MEEHAAPFHIQASPEAAAIPKLVLKHEDSFLVSDRSGDFPAHFEGELGFYHAGTRHLRWFEVRLNGARPLRLTAEAAHDNEELRIGLTNSDVSLGAPSEAVTVPRNTLYLGRHLMLAAGELVQRLDVASYHDVRTELTLEIIFAADFHDVFEVRGMHRAARGSLLGEERTRDTVRLRYRGLDGVERTTTLTFSPAPDVVASNRAVWRLALEPGGGTRIDVRIAASAGTPAPGPADAAVRAARRAARERLALAATRVVTDNDAFNAVLARSLVDLDMLLTRTPLGPIAYAGVPWYVAPFGRDSLLTALQLLPYHAGVAAGTLRFLAAWQGRVVNAFRDEEPGKILHEYRQGEMANLGEIPFVPYYGTVDATPLFVVLLEEYARWTGDLVLVREVWPAATAALRWMRGHGDRDGDGYLEYETRSRLGLTNQGWKDSADAVSHEDGRLARTPIALVEVQGYAYGAFRAGATLAHALGDDDTAAGLRAEAERLRERFHRDFWRESEGFFALALDGDKRPCDVMASNAGHCLWSGIVDADRARQVAKRLLTEDMFSGWGIRTLSTRERRYNPMSYHNGSVWPHDNALAAVGFRRYGLTDAILTVAGALYDAARHFEGSRIPELYCGFPRHEHYGPISYPVACAPQAWAAGSAFQMVTALLGMVPDALGRRITFESPVLPPWVRFLELHDLRVGSAHLDVGVTHGRDGASVELIGRRGDVEVIVRR